MNKETVISGQIREGRRQKRARIADKVGQTTVSRLDKLQERRLAPFEALAQRNAGLIARARLLHKARPEGAIETWIVLSHATDDNNGICALGRVSTTSSPYSAYTFGAYLTSEAREKKAACLMYGTGHDVLNLMTTSMTQLGKEQKTYPASREWGSKRKRMRSGDVHYTAYENERLDIVGKAESKTSSVLNPVSALRRAIFATKVTNGLDRLEETINMFEAAILNPDLNPELALIYDDLCVEAQEGSMIEHIEAEL